ncbi:hypothetical protein PAHAL_9G296500 [Panicum hallii]|jgi:hypothetical protein|uniref:Uncharacterized protein n=1 Tax=Panicum hallii TaxID=206008 RepID=A0A2T8I2X7_9POAL|nr:uncharacterized protein LOC112876872 [Panicum hallii]PVH32030.1 hypothetical protein PAHAL_9G296500 [Panicum hallii]
MAVTEAEKKAEEKPAPAAEEKDAKRAEEKAAVLWQGRRRGSGCCCCPSPSSIARASRRSTTSLGGPDVEGARSGLPSLGGDADAAPSFSFQHARRVFVAPETTPKFELLGLGGGDAEVEGPDLASAAAEQRQRRGGAEAARGTDEALPAGHLEPQALDPFVCAQMHLLTPLLSATADALVLQLASAR